MPSKTAGGGGQRVSAGVIVGNAGHPSAGTKLAVKGDSNSDTATDQSVGVARQEHKETNNDGPMEEDDDGLPAGAAMDEDDDEDDGVTPEHSMQASLPAVEAKDLPGIDGHQVAVVCNEVRGVFLVKHQQVLCNCPGCLCKPVKLRTFTPCQFERHAGSKAKKWKISIKLDADAAEEMGLDLSDQPMTIGQYYDRRGIEVKPLYKKGGVGEATMFPTPMEDPSSTTCSGGSPAEHAGPSRSSAEMMRKRKRAELAALNGTLVPASYPPRGGSYLAARYERAAHERRATNDFVSTKREWPLGGEGTTEDGQEAIAGLMQLTRGASTDLEASWRRGDAGMAQHPRGSSALVAMRGSGLDGLAEGSASFWRAKFDTLQTADAYYKHKAIFQLMYSIMEGADKKALYEEYLPILNDMDAFRLEQEFNTLWGFLDLMQETDFEAIKGEIRCYINGVLRREFRKLTNSTTVQVVAPEAQAAMVQGVLGGAQVEGRDEDVAHEV